MAPPSRLGQVACAVRSGLPRAALDCQVRELLIPEAVETFAEDEQAPEAVGHGPPWSRSCARAAPCRRDDRATTARPRDGAVYAVPRSAHGRGTGLVDPYAGLSEIKRHLQPRPVLVILSHRSFMASGPRTRIRDEPLGMVFVARQKGADA